MSDYSQITFFTPKDSLATGNPNKIIYGSDVDAELSAISTAIATKADVDGDAIGAGTPATELSVDNLKLDANKIISTNTDGDIELEPNGAGYVVITNVDVAAGEIDGTTIGANSAAAGTFTTANATTVDTTNLEVTNLKAKDGTAAGSIADVTGVVTLASSVLTTTDINGGTIDGAIIGGATPAAITGTTLTANTSLALATGATVTAILDEDNMASDSATALATQQSIKAYVDAQVTAQDLDVTTDSGTIAIDLDSETLTVAGGTGLDTSATGNTVTVAIDSTVATLTGAQTLTNKVLTSPDINTPDIDGGTIDGTVIGAATPAAGSFTTFTSNGIDDNASATAVTLDASGNVGIGNSSMSSFYSGGQQLVVGSGTSDQGITIYAGASDNSGIYFADSTSGDARYVGQLVYFHSSNHMGFYTDNSEAMRIDSSGNVGIGDSSPDGILDVEGSITIAGSQAGVIFNPSVTPANNNVGSIGLVSGTLNAPASANASSKISGLRVATTTSGSFNGAGEVAGVKVETFNGQSATLATGLYVDAPTGGDVNYAAILNGGNVGIGTTSPAHNLSLEQNNKLGWVSTVGSDKAAIEFSGSDDSLRFYNNTGSTERMRIDSSGNVGIGTGSPEKALHVNSGTSNIGLRVESSDATASIEFMDSGTTSTGTSARVGGISNDLFVQTNGSERMRIDASGNFLVGKTSNDYSTEGAIIRPDGDTLLTRDGTVLTVRRNTTDGTLVDFRKDAATVGTIGTNSDGDFCFTGASNVGIGFQGNAFVPLNGLSARTDNSKDVGAASVRFDDIYATNGTIQTSDANEKENIRELLEAEARVAQAAKGLLRAFQWKDSVAEKGDDARIHFGIIAQDLQAAFEAEGLDAGRYAMFIHSTWTDEETGEERSRMGVRYSELLAFIIAAL